MMTYHIDSHD